jgi:ketopantoate reductase
VKILVCGAGVIGTLYEARLQEGGHRVSVVARGERLADNRRYGLALEDIVGQGRSTTKVKMTERLGPNDQYDMALIAVRRDQVASVVPELTANHRIPTLIFMLNNPTGSSDLAQALGRDRVLLGFPGAGGTRDGHVVRYAMIAQQPTTLGADNEPRACANWWRREHERRCGTINHVPDADRLSARPQSGLSHLNHRSASGRGAEEGRNLWLMRTCRHAA